MSIIPTSSFSEINKFLAQHSVNIPTNIANNNFFATSESDSNKNSQNQYNIFSTGQNISQMSTSDFIKYFYNVFQDIEKESAKQQKTSSKENNTNNSDNQTSSGLPQYVRFGSHVIKTDGKSMEEIAKAFKKFYPATSTDKIISTLTQKYGTSADNTNSTNTGTNLNLNA